MFTWSKLKLVPAFILIVGATSCLHDNNPLSENLGQLDDQLLQIESTMRSHGDAVAGTGTLADIADEERIYDTDSNTLRFAIDHLVNDMGDCRHNRDQPSEVWGMNDTLDQMDAEFVSHRTAMAGSGDADDAHGEELRHQTELARLLESMHGFHMDMAMEADNYECGNHNSH